MMMTYSCGQCRSQWQSPLDEEHMPGCAMGGTISPRQRMASAAMAGQMAQIRQIVREEIERALNARGMVP